MIKKSLWIFLLIWIAIYISACICKEIEEDHFQINKIESKFMLYEIKDSLFDINETNLDTLKNETLVLRLDAYLDLVATEIKNASFVNAAYAWQCADKLIMVEDSIVDIQVLTMYEVDASHAGGSDVTAMFKKLNFKNNPAIIDGLPLINIVEEFNATTYFSGNPTSYHTGIIYWDSHPAMVGNVQFEIIFKCKSGAIHKVKTPTIYYKP